MIQEPQKQQEAQVIKIANSPCGANTYSKYYNRNLNSKPRIFLLTRPLKSPLVRTDTPVQAHQKQKELNLLQNVAITQTRQNVGTPFLTRSQTNTTSSVKSQASPLARKELVTQYQPLKDLNHTTVPQHSALYKPKSKDSLIIHQEIIQYPKDQAFSPQSSATASSSSSSSSNNHYQVLAINHENSVKKTIQTIPENTLVHLAKSKEKTATTRDMSPEQLTLASMAGIELTGADMSHTAADMSGAMPPTATVEEINVPVFIDEYLQQAAISTTRAATTSVTTNHINYNINNNNNISNNSPNSSNNVGEEAEENVCLDTFANFDFDIDLLTETNSNDQDMAKLQSHHQQQLEQCQLGVDGIQQEQQIQNNSNAEEMQKCQLQLMTEEFFLSNNSNYNILNGSTTNNNSSNIDKMDLSMSEDGFSIDKDAIYSVAPTSQNLDDTYDMIDDITNLSPDIENAVDFNQPYNDFSLTFDDNELSSHLYGMPRSMDAISQEISGAVPYVSLEVMSANPTVLSPPLSLVNDLSMCHEDTAGGIMEYCQTNNVNPLKRSSSPQTKKHMEEKRSKLRIDTKRRSEVAQQNPELSTPYIINTVLDNESLLYCMSPPETSNDIFNQLINSPTGRSIVKSEIDIDYNSNISPPYTPHSVDSPSSQTNFNGIINTAPSSPASSIATTSGTSLPTRRGRGRPAKNHSDIPDLSALNHLPETERKKLLERAKNNEASRKSRLKNKLRDLEMTRKENELARQNEKLLAHLKCLKKKERKLRQALKRRCNINT